MNILEANDDFNLELDLNVNVISPMWPENDFFSDSVLNNFNIDVDFPDTCDLTSSRDTNVIHDFIYNTDQLLCDQNETNNAYFEANKQDHIIESWLNSYNFDILNDNLFEIEDVDNISVSSAPGITTVSSPSSASVSTATSTNSILNWNRRRSLLYDKNDFISNTTNHRDRLKSITCAENSPPLSHEQRMFKCSVGDCNKTYYKASHLKSHMRRHSGVKPFACDWNECKWRFSRSDELARHKRSHSGIKPYSCDLCDKAFSRSDHLNKHSKVHMKKLALYGTPIITKKCNYKYLTVNRMSVE